MDVTFKKRWLGKLFNGSKKNKKNYHQRDYSVKQLCFKVKRL